ncbi:MAG: hypothetical protein U0271_12220 [Polyangiaceae bacterium]
MKKSMTSAVCAGALVVAAIAACSAGNEPTGSGGNDGGASTSSSASGGSGGSASTSSFAGGAGGQSSGAGGGNLSGHCDEGSCTAAGGVCSPENVCVIAENTGNIDQGTQGLLDAGGSADAAFRWLYPYDETVFPRGLVPPTLQFDGVAPDAIKLAVHFDGLDYVGYFAGSNPGRLKLSDAVWTALTLAADGNDSVAVDVTKVSGGQVTGPITEHWKIAQGSLRGTIYYETYDSQLAGGLGSVGIMKLAPNASQPQVLKTGCGNVCHTASADGSTLVASTAFPSGSAAYDLNNGGATIKSKGDNSYTYGGLYPDGSILVSSTNYRTWTPGFFGSGPSRVYNVTTGAQIATPSWDSAVTNAGNPAFSPDGKFIAFNHEDTGGGHSLAMMGYDKGSNTFSGLTDLANDPSRFLGWPAFTPDSKWVVYHAGSSNVFETDNGATGDLFMVNTQTKATVRLDAADGYANGQNYLPANDPNLSFAPTVLPVAVGGYFWTVFTSHRSYGNTLPSLDNNGQNGKLWVAAIDLDPSDGIDPSHPAFFLDGQEYSADNLRGFWVLDPCQGDGVTCQTGLDCCGGYCENGSCSTTTTECSDEFELCSTAADCCDPTFECINGHCAQPPPQ